MEMLSIAEVARQLHVSRQRAYELAARGRIPATRMGRRVIVPRAAWDRWCERQVQAALAHCGSEVGGKTSGGGTGAAAIEGANAGVHGATAMERVEGCHASAC